MNTKEKIIEALDGKTPTQALAERYVEVEEELINELSKLSRWGCDCDCGQEEIIRTIYDGNYPEINSYCLKCGGFVD